MSFQGFTLIEIMITTLIGAIMLAGLFHLFSSGIRTSQQGSSHLTNMQTASILMSQIEKDLSLMTGNLTRTGVTPNERVSWDIVTDYGTGGTFTLSQVVYQPEPENRGYRRTETAPGEEKPHIFGQDLVIEVTFEKLTVPPDNRYGFGVEVSVSRPPKRTEKITLHRFIYCYNVPENRAKITHGWKWE